MDIHETGTARTGQARRRQMVRQRKQPHRIRVNVTVYSSPCVSLVDRITALKQRASSISALKGGMAGVLLFAVVVIIYHSLSGRILPNVWVMGVPVGGLSTQEAQDRLLDVWYNQLQIQLVDGERVWSVSPGELGLKLDVRKTVEAAHGVGLAGIPFGYGVEPAVNVDTEVIQAYLTGFSSQANIEPVNAGYQWENETIVGVRGLDGRALDIDATVARLTRNPSALVNNQRLQLVMTTVRPEVSDPSPYLADVQQLASQPFELIGYDPFIDQSIAWATTRETFVSWLEAGTSGLVLREKTFLPFIEAQNATLHATENSRYLDQIETISAMREAIQTKQQAVSLRIRYHPSTYTVVSGDSGYRIARKTGLPFYLVQEANPGRDLSVLSPGDQVNLPARDVTVPLKPVGSKRIVVNLDTQWLVAYENGQEVFSWAISSGIEEAPTYPGIFQILSHEPVAYGSSYKLCDETGCGQWELNWFMGIYEVTPGLANGFHGAVLLPNGTYLGGNNVGRPYTLGCVMSRNDDAKKLYDWAEEGTIVEIISSEYQPQSELGRRVLGQGLLNS